MRRAAFLAAAFLAGPLHAEVALHELFRDGAVLQQGAPLRIWGTAAPDEPVRVELARHAATTTSDAAGRWTVELPALEAGGPFVLSATGANEATSTVHVGEVWLAAGQSNMEWPLRDTEDAAPVLDAAAGAPVRLLRIARNAVHEPASDALVAVGWVGVNPETAGDLPAVPAHFATRLAAARGVAVGVIVATWPGTPAEAWAPAAALAAEPELAHHVALAAERRRAFLEQRDSLEAAYAAARERILALQREGRDVALPDDPNPDRNPGGPAHLWNGMVAPLARLPFRGVIWYQGESNVGRAFEYRTLFPTMIRGWREAFGREVPFLFVQIAPFQAISAVPQPSARAELREAQDLTVRAVPGTGMAVTSDIGSEHDLHPRRKAPVGARLALLARRIAYGEDIFATAPALAEVSVRGGTMTLRFDRAVTTRGEPPVGFALGGRNGVFQAAQARQVDATTFQVTSREVFSPVWVRYGWADHPVGNLAGEDGLPVAPFRTDDLPGITWPRELLAPRRQEVTTPGI